MEKINKYGNVPIGILEQIYSTTYHWQDYDSEYSEHSMKRIYENYETARHLFAMDLIKAK